MAQDILKGVSPSVVQHQQYTFSGPLPPPDLLAQYNAIYPEAAKRIFEHAEKEQQHRHKVVERALHYQGRAVLMGLAFGFSMGLAGIVTGGFLLYAGKNLEGFTTLVASVGTLVGAFIYKQHQQTKQHKNSLAEQNR